MTKNRFNWGSDWLFVGAPMNRLEVGMTIVVVLALLFVLGAVGIELQTGVPARTFLARYLHL